MRMHSLAACIAAIGVVAGVATYGERANSAESQTPSAHGPSINCASLLGKFEPDGIIEVAAPQAAGSRVQLSQWRGQFDVTTPAHCLVRGSMAQRTGIDGKPYAIGFELRLPDKWNGRLLFQGGAHLGGRLHAAVGGVGTDNPLEKGFAIVTTDSGHRELKEPGGETAFAYDPQARIDFAYNGVVRTTVAARMLLQRYYGTQPTRSYFVGCSEGGRQGMLATQRFPAFFDGVVAGAPSLHLTNIAAARTFRNQSLAPFAPRDQDGRPDLTKTVTQADLQLVADRLVSECDELDGLKDGIVANRRACTFQLDALLCKPGQTTGCLGDDKVKMIKSVTAKTTTSTDHTLYPAFPIDTGIGEPAWYQGQITSPHGEDDRSRFVIYTTPPLEDVSPFTLNLDQWEEKTASMNALMDPTSADLTSFQKRGGKILFYHGTSDPYMSVNATTQYYEQLAATSGGEAQVNSFARLFVVPGMGHCTGGLSPNRFDLLTAVVNWVEKGETPQGLIAHGQADHPNRTRPLCPYPTYAHYKGGDPESAASFDCRM